MRYFGSKVTTIDALYDLVSSRVPSGSFCDPFGGIGSVSSHFLSKGYTVWSGDVLSFAYYFQVSRLRFSPLLFSKLNLALGFEDCTDIAKHLNSLSPSDGWFVKEYSIKRQFFSNNNAKKIQSCRLEIKRWAKNDFINHEAHAVLLAGLINSMDKVANTAGTYYAYLKNWHRKALRDFNFGLVEPVHSEGKGFCFHEPADLLVKRGHFDVLYLDPPYNERSYPHYYHLAETIANETTPKVHGISGVPDKVSCSSRFNRPRDAKNSLSDLLGNAHFKLLVFHYADDGLIAPREVRDILATYGNIEEFQLDCKGYTTKDIPRNAKHHLYLVRNV